MSETDTAEEQQSTTVNTTEYPFGEWAGKPATPLQEHMARWIPQMTGYNPDEAASKEEAFANGVRLAVFLRIPFQASPENKHETERRRVERLAEQERTRAERETKRAEAERVRNERKAAAEAERERLAAEKKAATTEQAATEPTADGAEGAEGTPSDDSTARRPAARRTQPTDKSPF